MQIVSSNIFITNLNEQARIPLIIILYEEEENRRISIVSAEIENDFYQRYTRVEEVVEFAKRMGYRKLVIATCVGLIAESRTLAKILRKNGFEVYGAACKTGSFMKKVRIIGAVINKITANKAPSPASNK